MIVKCNPKELAEIEINFDTSELYHRCHNCDNVLAVASMEDFNEQMDEWVKTSLVANNGTDGEIETSFYFTCPCCLAANFVGLNFTLTHEKQVLYFKAKKRKRPILSTMFKGIDNEEM